jgi:hypothetical protein
MAGNGWTYEKLQGNGWDVRWEARGEHGEFRLAFTFYRSEISIHTVEGVGATEAAAIAEAVEAANQWLLENPRYQPRR